MHPYRVPFRVDRTNAPDLALVNVSEETLRWLRVELLGPGLAEAPMTRRLGPGEALRVRVRGAGLAADSRLVVRWLRPNGEEYLWSVVF